MAILRRIPSGEGTYWIDKVATGGGPPVAVRCDNAFSPAVASDGSTLYFAGAVKRDGWIWDWEVRSASPENGPSRVMARIAGSRIPVEALNIQTILSPDGRSLAIPLTVRGTSNVWIMPAGGGLIRRMTDFGERAVVIARRVSWSPDANVFILEGLLK